MLSPFLHVGHVRLPLIGMCVAAGLMAALTLSQTTARLARLNPSAVWDAGMAMVLSALLVSRALLILGSWKSFLASPLLLLSLPSINDTGVLLTSAVMVIYLRRKRLSLFSFLDAMAAPFALLWASLSLGEAFAGTRDGMPTHNLLSIGAGGADKVQPVEFYTMVAALVLCGVLIRSLSRIPRPGFTTALGMMLAGAAIFLLDFLRLPSALFVAAMLDPVQWLGIAMMLVGAAVRIAQPAWQDTAGKESAASKEEVDAL